MIELPKSRPSRIQALTEKGHWGSATLHSLLSHQAKNQPGALAVADQPNKESLVGAPSVRLSFKELDIASDALAAQLLEKGAGAESRLLVQLPNIVELVVCFYASSKIGAVISPLPVQYGTHEISSLGATLSATHFIGHYGNAKGCSPIGKHVDSNGEGYCGGRGLSALRTITEPLSASEYGRHWGISVCCCRARLRLDTASPSGSSAVPTTNAGRTDSLHHRTAALAQPTGLKARDVAGI